MTEKQVRDRLLRWLSTTMGITVIQSYQGGKEPPEPYGVLNMILSDATHEDPVYDEFDRQGSGANEIDRQAPVSEWYWRFSLNVYGGEGKTLLRRVKTAERVHTATESLLPLSVFETSPIRDSTELLNEDFQSRAQMDIEVRGIVRDGLVIDVIEQAPVDTTRL